MNKKLSFFVLIAIIIVIALALYLNEKQKVKNDTNQTNNVQSADEYNDVDEKEAEERFKKDYEIVEKYLQDKSLTIESMEIVEEGKYKLVYLDGNEKKETDVIIEDGKIVQIDF